MIPQIIYIVIFTLSLIVIGYQHGKPKTGKHNLWIELISLIITLALLYWGGFFNPLFK